MITIKPDWPAPTSVVALTTTRQAGVSSGVYQGFNIAAHVDDDLSAVEKNRAQLQQACAGLKRLQWLEQVHGTQVVTAGSASLPQADASYSRERGLACVVMTADCLPVLLCNQAGTEVAAAHAGWRGLLDGVIENTVARFQSGSEQLMAWLGPAIGPAHFEVGPEIKQQFMAVDAQAEQAFTASPHQPGHYLADLYLLARQRLRVLGIEQVYGGDHCTYASAEQFYSYRRDGITGRMASLIYLNP